MQLLKGNAILEPRVMITGSDYSILLLDQTPIYILCSVWAPEFRKAETKQKKFRRGLPRWKGVWESSPMRNGEKIFVCSVPYRRDHCGKIWCRSNIRRVLTHKEEGADILSSKSFV